MSPTYNEFMLATEIPVEGEDEPTQKKMTLEEFMGAAPVDPAAPLAPQPRFGPSDLPAPMQSFLLGFSRFNADLARIPATAFGIAAIPQNALARATGWNIGAKAPDWLLDNPMATYYDESSKAFNAKARKFPDDTLESLVSDRRFADAGEYLAHSVIENSVFSLTAIGGSLIGVPQSQLLAGLGSVAGASNYKEGRKNNLDELENATAALINGTLEAVWERAGTFGLINWGERLFRDVGEQSGKVILKNTVKFVLGASLGEGNEELWTQLSQDMTNKFLGVEDIPWKDFPGRAIEAAVIGAGSGATMTAPGGVIKGLRAANAKNVDETRAQELLKRIGESGRGSTEATAAAAAPEPAVEPVTPEPAVPPAVPSVISEDVAVEEGVPVEPTEEPSVPIARAVSKQDVDLLFGPSPARAELPTTPPLPGTPESRIVSSIGRASTKRIQEISKSVKGPSTLAEVISEEKKLSTAGLSAEQAEGITDAQLSQVAANRAYAQLNEFAVDFIDNPIEAMTPVQAKFILDSMLRAVTRIRQIDKNAPIDIPTASAIRELQIASSTAEARIAAPGVTVAREIGRAAGITRPREKPAIGAFQALKERLRAESRAAALAARMTKKEIKSSQSALIEALEESKLAPEDRAKFIRTIKNIQTREQFIEALPDISNRVEQLIEASARRKAIKNIRTELKKIEPKKDKPGKFTAITQEALKRMKSALRLTQEQAATKRDAMGVDSSGNLRIPTPIDAIEGMMLNFVADPDNISAADLNNILETIRALKLSGKAARKVKQLRQEIELAEQREAVNSIVDSRPEGHVPVSNEDQTFSRPFAWWTRATNWQMGWNNLLNRISWNDKRTGTNKSLINELANVAVEKTAEKRGMRKVMEFLHREYRKAFGENMTAWDVETRMLKDSEQKDLGTFTDARGKQRKLVMSIDEARTLWMQTRDPSLAITFFGDTEGGMNYTPEMLKAINGLLTSADVQFTAAIFNFYNKDRGYYDRFNGVFSDVMGYNLPRNLFYSPIQRVFESRDADESAANQILGEIAHRNSILPSAGKKRVKNIRRIKQVGAIENFSRHTAQVEHYVAWARKIRQLRSLFGNEEIRTALKRDFGQDLMSKLDGFIDDFTRGGIDRSHEMTNLNTIKNNIVISTLALKPALAPKQLVSFAAFWDSIPTEHFVAGMIDFAKNPRKAIRILSSSNLLRTRGIALTPELGEAAKSKEFLVFELTPTVKNFLLFMVKMGDRGAILFGGWSVYRYHRTVLKKSGAKSLKAFEDAFDSSQQSPDLDQASWVQRGNSIMRMTGVFMSSQNQYLRKEIAATDDYFAGRIKLKEFGKQMFIYHILLPSMFQFIASGFRFEWKEMLRTAIIGSLNGWFIVHDFLIGIASTILGLKTFPSGSIIDSGFRQVRKALREVKEGDIDLETFIKVLKATSKVTGLATGLPAPAVIGLIEGAFMLMDAKNSEDYFKAFKRMAGWSNFVLNSGEDPNKKGSAF